MVESGRKWSEIFKNGRNWVVIRDRKFPARKISRGNREKALYFPRDAGREAGNEITKEKQSKMVAISQSINAQANTCEMLHSFYLLRKSKILPRLDFLKFFAISASLLS